MEQWKEDILAHYGVLGMKWGVRRYQSYDEKPRLSGKIGKEVGAAAKKVKRSISEKIESEKAKKFNESENKKIIKDRKNAVKNRRLLSDSELDKRINRLKKENDLKRFTTENLENLKESKKGESKIKKILGPPATKASQAILLGLGVYAGQKIVEKMLGKEAASLIKLPKK